MFLVWFTMFARFSGVARDTLACRVVGLGHGVCLLCRQLDSPLCCWLTFRFSSCMGRPDKPGFLWTSPPCLSFSAIRKDLLVRSHRAQRHSDFSPWARQLCHQHISVMKSTWILQCAFNMNLKSGPIASPAKMIWRLHSPLAPE